MAGWLQAGRSPCSPPARFAESSTTRPDRFLTISNVIEWISNRRLTIPDYCLRLPLIMTQIAIHTAQEWMRELVTPKHALLHVLVNRQNRYGMASDVLVMTSGSCAAIKLLEL